VRAADAAWVHKSRWEALSDADQARFAPIICPDFVIELRSPSDNLDELKEKMAQWVANGVQVGWLIDPESKTVSIYRLGEEPEILTHPTSIQGNGVMAGFELVMARIWE
jgi:Uma2 family endonuclease